MPFKMHPDDVNSRDWEFVLSDRFPSLLPTKRDSAWARRGTMHLSYGRGNAIAAARAALVNAWPDDTIEPWIESLERSLSLEPKEPVVSSSTRGEQANQASAAYRVYGSAVSDPTEMSYMYYVRLRKACQRFERLGIHVRPSYAAGKLTLVSCNGHWSLLRNAEMTVDDAELWLDHHEELHR